MSKSAQRVSAGNILANHEDQSPVPAVREPALGHQVYDRLASNIGILRTMFKENAQRPLCPHIDEIGPAIVRTFQITDPKDVAVVYELLVMSQRATGHAIAEFDSFSNILREHARKRETTARKALVKKQQLLALRGMKNAGALGSNRTSSAAGGGGEEAGAAGAAGGAASADARPKITSNSSSSPRAPSLASGAPAPPPARTQADWVAYLNQFASKGDSRLNWVEFAGAVHNLPPTWRRGTTLEPNDHWGCRAFFMTSASVENLPQSIESRVSTASLSAYFVGNKVIARTSKSVALGSTIRNVMAWEDDRDDGIITSITSSRAGGAEWMNAKNAAKAKEQQEGSATKKGAADASASARQPAPQPGANRALRLRNEAQKKWIIAHPTDPLTGNVDRLPKLA